MFSKCSFCEKLFCSITYSLLTSFILLKVEFPTVSNDLMKVYFAEHLQFIICKYHNKFQGCLLKCAVTANIIFVKHQQNNSVFSQLL